ncbi:hypothetical protein OQA88_10352 [Cercophora sp. LCS_1]
MTARIAEVNSRQNNRALRIQLPDERSTNRPEQSQPPGSSTLGSQQASMDQPPGEGNATNPRDVEAAQILSGLRNNDQPRAPQPVASGQIAPLEEVTEEKLGDVEEALKRRAD